MIFNNSNLMFFYVVLLVILYVTSVHSRHHLIMVNNQQETQLSRIKILCNRSLHCGRITMIDMIDTILINDN